MQWGLRRWRLEVLRLHQGRWRERATWSSSALARAEPFDALELEDLWRSESVDAQVDELVRRWLPAGLTS